MAPKQLAGVLALAALLVAIAWWGTWDRAVTPAPVPELATGDTELVVDDPIPSAGEVDSARLEAAVEHVTEETAALEPTHRVTGRVVDENRRPVAAARVGLASSSSNSTVTGAEGRFELLLALADDETWRKDAAVSRDTRGRAAMNPIHLRAASPGELQDVDAGTLVLLPAHALRVTVRLDGAPAPDADIEVALGHIRALEGRHRTDARGEAALTGLPPGPVHLAAHLDGHEARTRVFVPDVGEVSLDLQPMGGIDVHVVDARTGAGIAGAELRVSEQYLVPAALPTDLPGTRMNMSGEFFSSRQLPAPSTDADGRARVEGLAPDGRYRLGVRANGYENYPRQPASGSRLAAGAEPVRVELAPIGRRRVSWPVLAGELPIPANGTVIEFRHRAGSYSRGEGPPLPSSGRMEGSTLIAEGVSGQVSLIAMTPDGALARLWVRDEESLGSETTFRAPRRIVVHVRDDTGAPVEGARVVARNQGNNALGDPATTDATGRAVLEGLYGGLAEVSVLAPGEPGLFGRNVGSVDLEEGSAELDVVLSTPLRARARLFVRIDGATALPAQFELRGQARVEVVEEHPERGELLLELDLAELDSTVTIFLRALGFAPASVDLDFDTLGEVASATVDLERTATLTAWVKRPAEGYVSILPQSFDPDRGQWANARSSIVTGNGLSYPNGPDDSYVFTGLTPGRWRVLDTRSEVASDEVTIDAGARRAEVELDLAALEWVEGRVEAEDPAELARVRVLVEGPTAAPTVAWRPGAEPPDGARLRDGSFRVRVLGDREVTLVPWHPWLEPALEGGRARVRGGRDGVVLRLATGDEVRLPASQLGPRHQPRVARYADGAAVEGEPLAWHHMVLVDGVLRCGLPRGRWTLVVDPGHAFAPLVLPGVQIDGVTLLPEAEFSAGSSLVVQVLVPEGSDAPRIFVHAERLDAPAYGRSLNSSGDAVVRLEGLGPGRYLVRMNAIMEMGQGIEEEIELDGINELELELDLR